jgi:protein translocase SEC61 complex gamma subunit
MDIVDYVFRPVNDFYKESKAFIVNCKKPDAKEFSKIAFATTVGFLIMGFIGFFVKLIHIPINNIIIGGH